MFKTKKATYFGFFLLLLFAVKPLSAGETSTEADSSVGKAFYDHHCMACHAPDGSGNLLENTPAIGGQVSWYLTRQVENFKKGIRGNHEEDLYGMQMRPMAHMLIDESSTAAVVAYISSLKPQKMPITVKGDSEKGKSAFVLCATCHGPDGRGNKELGSPRIDVQQDWYLVRQLENFKAGRRGVHPEDLYGMQMRPMALTLANDEAIKDMVAFINTLKAQPDNEGAPMDGEEE